MKATNPPASKPPALALLKLKRPLIIGHRGCCGSAPENTLPSFQRALDAGADLIELDYQHSRDGIPVVIHDDTLDRTTTGRRRGRRACIRVGDRTANEILAFDAGRWFHTKFATARVPSLREALRFIVERRGVPLIEHKSGDALTCVKLLRELKLVNRVVVISFDWNYLRAFHELEPRQFLGALGPPVRLPDGTLPRRRGRVLSTAWLDRLPDGVQLIVWNRNVSGASLQLAGQRGLPVWVYTVNSPALARRLTNLGVKGIITDNPDKLTRSLAGMAR